MDRKEISKEQKKVSLHLVSTSIKNGKLRKQFNTKYFNGPNTDIQKTGKGIQYNQLLS